MALQAHVGTFDCPASTGSSAVTGVGFQPQAIIFTYTTRTSDGSGGHARIGVGFATGASNRFALGVNSTDIFGTTLVQRSISAVDCIALITNDALTQSLEADFVSFDADGFTLDWTIVTSGADIHYLALAGLTDAEVTTFALATSTGNLAVTGVGFEPDGALFLTGGVAATTKGGGDTILGVSAADGTDEVSLAITQDDNAASAIGRTLFETGKLLQTVLVAGATDGESTFVSFDADGFTVNIGNGYAGAYIAAALCLLGIRMKVGVVTVPAGTGSQAVTGVGFQPSAVLMMSNHAATSVVVNSSHSVFFGMASGSSNRATVSSAHVQGSDPTTCDHDSDTTKLVKLITAGTPTVDLAADLTSFDSDGFTLNWTTVGTGASTDQIAYVAFGDVATPSASASRGQVVFVG
jgi:hypothetical protein